MLTEKSIKDLLRDIRTNKEKGDLFTTVTKSLYRKLNMDMIKIIVNDNVLNKTFTIDGKKY